MNATTRFILEPRNLPRLTEAEAALLDAMTSANIDYSDIPELPETFWVTARPQKAEGAADEANAARAAPPGGELLDDAMKKLCALADRASE